MRRCSSWGRLLFAWALLGGVSQAAERTTVEAAGAHVIELMPDTIRIAVALDDRGTDPKAMLATMSSRTAELRKGLEAMNPVRGSIRMGEPRIVQIPPEIQRQLSSALMRLKRLKSKEQSAPVVVTVRVTAEWPLMEGDHVARLLQAVALQKKVDELARPPAAKSGEDDEEPDEQSMQTLRQVTGQDDVKPGASVVAFVRRLPEATRQSALAGAFAAARAEAQRMAEAAGSKLGPLVSLTQGRPEDEERGSMDYRSQEVAQKLRSDQRPDAPPEVLDPILRMLRYRVTVRATFELTGKS